SVPPQSMSVDQPSGIVKLMSPLLRVPGDCGEVDSWGRNSHGAVGASIWVTSGSGSEDSSSPSGTYSPPAGSRSGASDCGVCSEPARGSSEGRKTVRVSTSATTTSSTAAALRPPTTSMVAMLRGGSPPGPLPRPAPGGPPDGPRGSPGPPPALADPPRGSRPAPESPWKSGSRGPPGGCPEPLPPCGCCVTCAPSIVGRTRLTLLSGGTGSVWADEPAEPKRRCSGAYAAVRLGCREIYTPHRARDVVGGGAAGRREGCSSRSSLGAPTGRVRVDSAFCTYPAAAEAADSRRFS